MAAPPIAPSMHIGHCWVSGKAVPSHGENGAMPEHAFANVKESEARMSRCFKARRWGWPTRRSKRNDFLKPMVYEITYQGQPHLLKGDASSFQRFCHHADETRHDASARELMLLFYNLYPRHEYAPTALLHAEEQGGPV